MLIPTEQILAQARRNGYAVGAFNVYNLEGVMAVKRAAEQAHSPVILRILPTALKLGGSPLIALCLETAQTALVPMSVHLDHCPSAETISIALEAGISSVMADGSHLTYAKNMDFTRNMVVLAQSRKKSVEAELGKLAGSEDGITAAQREASLTDPIQAKNFVAQTGVQALAVCIGNVHGAYHEPPDLDFDRLAAIAKEVHVPLVLHGTSGLPDGMIRRVVSMGVCKFNVNTELRNACLQACRDYLSETRKAELVVRMEAEIAAMARPVSAKIELFGSADRAKGK